MATYMENLRHDLRQKLKTYHYWQHRAEEGAVLERRAKRKNSEYLEGYSSGLAYERKQFRRELGLLHKSLLNVEAR